MDARRASRVPRGPRGGTRPRHRRRGSRNAPRVPPGRARSARRRRYRSPLEGARARRARRRIASRRGNDSGGNAVPVQQGRRRIFPRHSVRGGFVPLFRRVRGRAQAHPSRRRGGADDRREPSAVARTGSRARDSRAAAAPACSTAIRCTRICSREPVFSAREPSPSTR